MKQPKNYMAWVDWNDSWSLLIDADSGQAWIAEGKTKLSALKAAKRRCERFIRDLDRMINEQ